MISISAFGRGGYERNTTSQGYNDGFTLAITGLSEINEGEIYSLYTKLSSRITDILSCEGTIAIYEWDGLGGSYLIDEVPFETPTGSYYYIFEFDLSSVSEFGRRREIFAVAEINIENGEGWGDQNRQREIIEDAMPWSTNQAVKNYNTTHGRSEVEVETRKLYVKVTR